MTSKYAHYAQNVHNVHHVHALVNYPPMMKPPGMYEHSEGKDIDVARAQFVPKMAKRNV